MSSSEHNQFAEEQAFRDLMEGHQENEFLDDDGAEDVVPIRRGGATANQEDDDDLPALVAAGVSEGDRTPPRPGGAPPPPPPGRPGHHPTARAPIRTTGTILGRNPAAPSVGVRMGMNPTFSPRPSHPHIPPKDESRPYKSALQPQHFDNLKSADEWPI